MFSHVLHNHLKLQRFQQDLGSDGSIWWWEEIQKIFKTLESLNPHQQGLPCLPFLLKFRPNFLSPLSILASLDPFSQLTLIYLLGLNLYTTFLWKTLLASQVWLGVHIMWKQSTLLIFLTVFATVWVNSPDFFFGGRVIQCSSMNYKLFDTHGLTCHGSSGTGCVSIFESHLDPQNHVCWINEWMDQHMHE